jgi:hypothetical protein
MQDKRQEKSKRRDEIRGSKFKSESRRIQRKRLDLDANFELSVILCFAECYGSYGSSNACYGN